MTPATSRDKLPPGIAGEWDGFTEGGQNPWRILEQTRYYTNAFIVRDGRVRTHFRQSRDIQSSILYANLKYAASDSAGKEETRDRTQLVRTSKLSAHLSSSLTVRCDAEVTMGSVKMWHSSTPA